MPTIKTITEETKYVPLEEYQELVDERDRLLSEITYIDNRNLDLRKTINEAAKYEEKLWEIFEYKELRERAPAMLFSARQYIATLKNLGIMPERDAVGAWRIIGDAALELASSHYDSLPIIKKYSDYTEPTPTHPAGLS